MRKKESRRKKRRRNKEKGVDLGIGRQKKLKKNRENNHIAVKLVGVAVKKAIVSIRKENDLEKTILNQSIKAFSFIAKSLSVNLKIKLQITYFIICNSIINFQTTKLSI